MSPIEKSINDSKDRNKNSLWMMILKLFQFYVLSFFKRCLRPFYLSLGFYRTVHFVHADQIKLGFFLQRILIKILIWKDLQLINSFLSGQKGSVENTFVFLSKLVHCVHIAVVQWLCTGYARAMLRRGGGRSKNPRDGQ